MSKHTPAPWRVGINQFDGAHVVSEEHGLICETPGGGYCGLQLNESGKAQSLANARLIAAAPEMYESASDFLKWFETFIGKPTMSEIECSELTALRAALAKVQA